MSSSGTAYCTQSEHVYVALAFSKPRSTNVFIILMGFLRLDSLDMDNLNSGYSLHKRLCSVHPHIGAMILEHINTTFMPESSYILWGSRGMISPRLLLYQFLRYLYALDEFIVIYLHVVLSGCPGQNSDLELNSMFQLIGGGIRHAVIVTCCV